ncbi:patatin-like protein [Streptomyces sp. NBC_01613]|uniref:patatin-like protein n=2 Tax=Streptomyces sp. NBC_01613 TaxID=2975896 RepID=UPI00386DBDE4
MPDPVDGVKDADVQDIRLAVVMNGGVSLAVWISGVTLELHRLATARYGTCRAYQPLLKMLQAKASVDVVAGTSAGGINGAFLALGLARRTGIEAMRDLWRDEAAIGRLLRDAFEKHPPSVLKGDAYFLPQVTRALRNIAEGDAAAVDACQGPTSVELILTGTLWRGRQTSFSDDMGVRITEVDRDARFCFGWRADGSPDGTVCDLNAESAVDELAAAARCTSSFPGAFEPHWVQVSSDHGGGEGSWPSHAGAVNFRDSQYVVDGGLLLNKPVRPALEAVYRQPAQLQVRRVLAYVVPDPGEQPPQEQSAALPNPEGVTSPPPGPTAPQVLLGVLTRLRATDSVSRELEEIRRRNAAAHIRRRARDRFATALVQDAGSLATAAWPAYIEVRIDNAARTIGQLLAVGQHSEGAGRWSETDLVAQIRSLLEEDDQEAAVSFIPQPGLGEAVERAEAAWDWGQSTVLRLRDMAVDVLKRAVWLAPLESTGRAGIVTARARISDVFKDVKADGLNRETYWAAAAARLADPIPARATDALGRASNTAQLRGWLRTALSAWDEQQPVGVAERRRRQYGQAADLARHLADCADSLGEIVGNGNATLDPDGSEQGRLQALYDCLLAPHHNKAASPEIVLGRMLRLEVVQLAFSGAAPDVEQEVELIQFSAKNPTLITGRQLHHFGAFWRSSWRVNDWIHGRLDGAAHIVRMLMSPERLRQLGTVYGSPQEMVRDLRACAVAADNRGDREWLKQHWQRVEEQVHGYVTDHLVPPAAAAGLDPASPDPRLNTCIEAITQSLQLRILREDLGSLAAALRRETAGIAEEAKTEKDEAQTKSDGEGENKTDVRSITRAGREWLACYDAKRTPLSPQDLWDQWSLAADIGRQTIRDDHGSDYFARTVAQAAAVTANVARTATSSGFLNKIKPIGTVLDAFRGYTLAVWAMVAFLTRGSNIGRNTVHLVLAVGGALLGVSLVVPAVPLVVPLAGTLLLTAGWSTAALLTANTRPVGWRLLPLALLILAVLAAYLTWQVRDHGPDNLLGFLIKAAVVILVILLGWWIARASRPSKRGSAT